MIRALSVARAALKLPSLRLLLAGAAISYGINALIEVVSELREDVAALSVDVEKVRQAASTMLADEYRQSYGDREPLGPPNPAEADEDLALLVDDLGDR